MKLKIAATLFLCFQVVFLFAQNRLADPRMVYVNTITPAELKAHLSVLASDSLQGRETATPGQQMAADYISNYYKSIGIPAVASLGGYYQQFDLMQYGFGNMQFTAGKENFQFIDDFYCFPASGNTADIQANEIIFLGYGIDDIAYSDYANVDVEGKVIIVWDGEPFINGKSVITKSEEQSEWSTEWQKKIQTATDKKVRALLIIDPEIAKLSANSYYVNYLKSTSLKLLSAYKPSAYCPYLFVSPEIAKALLSEKKLNKASENIEALAVPVSFTAKTNFQITIEKKEEIVQTENVLGYIEGGELKDELIVVSAHYDHLGIHDGVVYNGADDDGSGTVGLLELADAVMQAKNAGYPLKRSVLFLSFTGEEKGLYGSLYYTDNPVFPLANTVADLNIDMIGRVDDAHLQDTNYVYVIGSNFLSTELHDINAYNAKTYTNLSLDYGYNTTDDPNRYYYRSDHYNFAKNNIPIIFFFNGTHADYHQPTDDIEKIHFPLLSQRVQLVFHDLWSLANMERRIIVDVKE